MDSLRRFGRGTIKTIALVLIIGSAAGLGWFVWQSKNSTDKTLENTSQGQGTGSNPVNTEAGQKESEHITEDWTPISSQKGKFSLRYPKTWVQPVNRDLCSPELFDRAIYLGPDTDSVLKCGSEYFGQMSVSSADGDKRADNALGTGYKDVPDREVTINGVVGHRIAGVALAPAPNATFSPPEGTIEVRYIFFTPANTTYVARYTQAPKGNAPSANVLNDFDLMVTKTLAFSP